MRNRMRKVIKLFTWICVVFIEGVEKQETPPMTSLSSSHSLYQRVNAALRLISNLHKIPPTKNLLARERSVPSWDVLKQLKISQWVPLPQAVCVRKSPPLRTYKSTSTEFMHSQVGKNSNYQLLRQAKEFSTSRFYFCATIQLDPLCPSSVGHVCFLLRSTYEFR